VTKLISGHCQLSAFYHDLMGTSDNKHCIHCISYDTREWHLCSVDCVSASDVHIAMDTTDELVPMDTTAEPVETALRSVPVVASRMSTVTFLS